LADDHINIAALQSDTFGSIFAVVKTSLGAGDQPSIVLLVGKRASGDKLSWRTVTVTNGSQSQTRPILLIDTSNKRLYVFTADESGGAIHVKSTPLAAPAFDPNTRGQPFISQAGSPFLNDPTSTKQLVNATTNLVVLASYDNGSHPSGSPATTDVYAHNAIDIPLPPLNERLFVPLARR
jgi:hypothetical protein